MRSLSRYLLKIGQNGRFWANISTVNDCGDAGRDDPRSVDQWAVSLRVGARGRNDPGGGSYVLGWDLSVNVKMDAGPGSPGGGSWVASCAFWRQREDECRAWFARRWLLAAWLHHTRSLSRYSRERGHFGRFCGNNSTVNGFGEIR